MRRRKSGRKGLIEGFSAQLWTSRSGRDNGIKFREVFGLELGQVNLGVTMAASPEVFGIGHGQVERGVFWVMGFESGQGNLA